MNAQLDETEGRRNAKMSPPPYEKAVLFYSSIFGWLSGFRKYTDAKGEHYVPSFSRDLEIDITDITHWSYLPIPPPDVPLRSV